ncbi:MAG: serine/threonine protein kinase [Candidatus Riflebacteria bacterium]|nr:serine/threonine protein kinase [Candidatus Riflebacteria bacterium]
MAADVLDILSPEFLARYQMVRELGRGAMGAVFLGKDRALARPVAIKFMLGTTEASASTLLKRFEREAQVLGRIQHPNLVRVYDVGIEQSWPFIVFEYFEGDPLDTVVERDGPMPGPRVEAIALELLGGLEALHKENVVHRDLKPSNVLLTAEGARIIDLGIARVTDTIEELTRTGRTVGTPDYMAPEQVVSADVGPTADLYSLGVMMFFCLTRRTPFEGSPVQVMALKARQDPPGVETIAPVAEPLATVVNRLTARQPADRPRSAAEVRALLRPGAARARRTTRRTPALPAPTTPPSPDGVASGKAIPGPGVQTRKTPARRDLWWVPWAVPALAVLAAAWFILRPGRPVLSLPVVVRELRAVTVRFQRRPPGPAQLRVTVGSSARVLVPASDDWVEHRVRLSDLNPGELVTVQPIWENVHGPSTSFRFQPVSATDLTLAWTSEALQVSFSTGLAVSCRLQIRTRRGYEWLPSRPDPQTSHRFSIPRSSMPFSGRFQLEYRIGEETTVDRPLLPDEALLVYLEGVLAWIVDTSRQTVGRIYADSEAIDRQHSSITTSLPAFRRALKQHVDSLPPAWFWEEVAGKGGILDNPGIPPDKKSSLYESIGALENLDAATDFLKYGLEYPHQKIYGEHFGPSRTAHYSRALVIPIAITAVDPRQVFQLFPPFPWLEMDPNWAVELKGTARLGRLKPGARVEIHVRGRVSRGRFVRVLVNDRFVVRLNRPDRTFPDRTPADIFTAFDLAFLKDGENSFVFTCPLAAPLLENMQAFLPYVEIQPPGFELCVQE